jgi:hypothetical protein
VYKMKHPERFNEWWRPLTKQGDPSHRHNLVGEAFDAGYEAGKRAALMTLGRKLVEEYATQETLVAEELRWDRERMCAPETPAVPDVCPHPVSQTVTTAVRGVWFCRKCGAELDERESV